MSDRTVKLSTGVVLRVSAVSPFLLQAVVTAIDKNKPRVPVIFIPADDRSEENPNDPAYLEALEAWEGERNVKLHDAMIALGTTLAERPDSVPAIESPDWCATLTFLGLPLPASEIERYVKWVMYVAAPAVEDSAEIVKAVQIAAGIPEVKVAEAAALFRRRMSGGADT